MIELRVPRGGLEVGSRTDYLVAEGSRKAVYATVHVCVCVCVCVCMCVCVWMNHT